MNIKLIFKKKKIIKNSLKILNDLRYPTGVMAASFDSTTGYDKSWIRDNIYEAIGLEVSGRQQDVEETYHALLDVMKKKKWKILRAINHKPQFKEDYIHARFDPHTFEEFPQEWGNMQNDSIGALLFKIGDLQDKKYNIIRDYSDIRILKLIVKYLQSVRYWEDEDNGVWEHMEEVHSSSIGACVAGLQKISNYIPVDQGLILLGQDALNKLLPRESETRKVCLSQLSLIYPFGVLTPHQRDTILFNVEKYLTRPHGMIRFFGDNYYNNGYEAEWPLGFAWLAIIYKQLGNKKRHNHFINKLLTVMNKDCAIPELFYGFTPYHNKNIPLGWSQSLMLSALH